MPFPESVVEYAWSRSRGRCECRRVSHGHDNVRCNKILMWRNRGLEGIGAWEAHHKSISGGDGLSNCEILCWDCHSKTI
jgi:hypothetical protein